MPLIETKGAASAQGFGEFAKTGVATYIEDVFSTYLYTGDDSTSRLIQNNIDLSTKGGMVWLKRRDGAQNHALYDTARGATYRLISNLTNAQDVVSGVSAFNTNGFTMGADLNYAGQTMASWTFRKQPKFFDVVTYTGNGQSTARGISHNLGSRPGCIIVKRTDSTGDWWVAFDATGNGTYLTKLKLNSTQASTGSTGLVHSSTSFTCNLIDDPSSYDVSVTNTNGATYVAYLFAHNAGGFGLTGTDNVISCGSLTTDGSGNATVNLGYEAQWVLMKKTSGAEGWMLFDNMRGLLATQGPAYSRKLVPNLTNAESDGNECSASSTGFNVGGVVGGATYVYVAIRRGPMKVPTSGTSVFSAVAYTGDGNVGRTVSTTITPDLSMTKGRSNSYVPFWNTRLQGKGLLYSSATTEERLPTGFSNGAFSINTNAQAQIVIEGGSGGAVLNSNESGATYINWNFRRAPSFFDEVCYAGQNTTITLNHNLGVVPELVIVKNRSFARDWAIWQTSFGVGSTFFYLNQNYSASDQGINFFASAPTATQISFPAPWATMNQSGYNFIAYLFATCAGVSKVGSYTGTGTTLQVDCGFTGGARFVLIKRTDSTGEWYTYDSTRGIVAGNDPYVFMHSAAAEVTTTDYIDPYSAGFEISSTAPAAINASGGTFIFLAIA